MYISLDPDYDFDMENGESLPRETKSIEIPVERRETHTLDSIATIENWMKNFPNPPHLENTYPIFLA
jgi:hypothetical protein